MIMELAVNALGTLVGEMVFIGGCATGLLITDLAAPVMSSGAMTRGRSNKP